MQLAPNRDLQMSLSQTAKQPAKARATHPTNLARGTTIQNALLLYLAPGRVIAIGTPKQELALTTVAAELCAWAS